MNKLAEKVVSAMNDDELERLVDDHYASESQTLTTGAEHNLLKLAELRGRMSAEQKARWSEIKEGFLRVQRLGGKDDDPVARVTGTLGGLDVQLRGIRETLAQAVAGEKSGSADSLASGLKELTASLERLTRPKLEVSLSEPANPALALVDRQLDVIERLLAQSEGSAGPALEALARAVGELQRSPRWVSRRFARSPSPSPLTARRTSSARVSSLDVCSNGGVFVATYEKPPALGTPLVGDPDVSGCGCLARCAARSRSCRRRSATTPPPVTGCASATSPRPRARSDRRVRGAARAVAARRRLSDSSSCERPPSTGEGQAGSGRAFDLGDPAEHAGGGHQPQKLRAETPVRHRAQHRGRHPGDGSML